MKEEHTLSLEPNVDLNQLDQEEPTYENQFLAKLKKLLSQDNCTPQEALVEVEYFLKFYNQHCIWMYEFSAEPFNRARGPILTKIYKLIISLFKLSSKIENDPKLNKSSLITKQQFLAKRLSKKLEKTVELIAHLAEYLELNYQIVSQLNRKFPDTFFSEIISHLESLEFNSEPTYIFKNENLLTLIDDWLTKTKEPFHDPTFPGTQYSILEQVPKKEDLDNNWDEIVKNSINQNTFEIAERSMDIHNALNNPSQQSNAYLAHHINQTENFSALSKYSIVEVINIWRRARLRTDPNKQNPTVNYKNTLRNHTVDTLLNLFSQHIHRATDIYQKAKDLYFEINTLLQLLKIIESKLQNESDLTVDPFLFEYGSKIETIQKNFDFHHQTTNQLQKSFDLWIARANEARAVLESMKENKQFYRKQDCQLSMIALSFAFETLLKKTPDSFLTEMSSLYLWINTPLLNSQQKLIEILRDLDFRGKLDVDLCSDVVRRINEINPFFHDDPNKLEDEVLECYKMAVRSAALEKFYRKVNLFSGIQEELLIAQGNHWNLSKSYNAADEIYLDITSTDKTSTDVKVTNFSEPSILSFFALSYTRVNLALRFKSLRSEIDRYVNLGSELAKELEKVNNEYQDFIVFNSQQDNMSEDTQTNSNTFQF